VEWDGAEEAGVIYGFGMDSNAQIMESRRRVLI